MNGMKLISTGRALPQTALTNEDMRRFVETSDEWIVSRTGIRQRYFCGEGETAFSLAQKAAREAIERSGIDRGQIGCVICATMTADYVTPSLACLLQASLGLPEDIPAADINAACSGFLYALEAARGYLAGREGRYALVVGCEMMSRLLDMSDRNTCVLFGDGAGAAVFEYAPDALYASLQGSRGDKLIWADGAGSAPSHMHMNGAAVFRFAAEMLPRCVRDMLVRTGLSLEEIDWIVCHQANERIIDFCIQKLNAPAEKFYKNIARYGNTSAASIPIALDEMREQGLLRSGMRVLCVGFGAGLTWAAALFVED